MSDRRAEGVLLTGVYGSGKSSVAVEIAYLLERHGEPYALLDLFFGAAQHRLLLGHLPLTDEFIGEVVDVILNGIRPR